MVDHMSLRDGDILYPAVVPVEPLLAQMQHFLELVAEPTTAPQSDAKPRNPRHFGTIEGGRNSASGGRTTKNTQSL